jgi:hypothetical protein
VFQKKIQIVGGKIVLCFFESNIDAREVLFIIAPVLASAFFRGRRNFLRCCGLTAAVALVSPWQTVLAAPARRALRFMPLQKLNFQTFARQLNTTFQVQLADGTVVPLQLVEAERGVARKTAGPQRISYESFSLIFTGPLEPALDQRIHAFAHPRIGQFEIFIVPVVSRDTSLMHYQCIFNRPLLKSAGNV